jgi:hypothetical protein
MFTTILIYLAMALSPLSTEGLMSTYEATPSVIEAPAQAPLNHDRVEVQTSPAPAPAPAVEAPTQAPAEAPQVDPMPLGAPGESAPETAPHAPVQCEEDMPCWDCSANDSRTCIDGVPAEVGTATAEDSAWMSLEAIGPDVEVLEGHILEYAGTVTGEPTDLTAVQFHVMDTETENVFHIFQYTRVFNA